MKFVDLSVVLNEQTPVYPGDPETKIAPAGVFDKDGYNDHYVSAGTHAGTHMDAPLHMLDGGKTLDQFPVEHFIGRGRLIKVEDKSFDLEKVKNAGIEAGDIVLFWTALSDDFDKLGYFEDYPEIPAEIAEYLVEQKIKIVGVDMCSPDHPPYKIHKILLSGDVLIIENLVNLAELEGQEFTIYALPVKFQLDGAPVRVIAELL